MIITFKLEIVLELKSVGSDYVQTLHGDFQRPCDIIVLFLCYWLPGTQWCLTLCDTMDWSMPGFPVLHYFPGFAQTHAHWVSDAIQPSQPLSSPSAFNLSQHQGIFQWVSSSHQVNTWRSIGASASVSVLPVSIQGWFSLRLTGLISLISKGLFTITLWKHEFFSTQPFLLSSSHILTRLLEKP